MRERLRRIWYWMDDNIVKTTITLVVLAILVVVLWPMSVITIPAGHVGVKWSRFFGGTDVEYIYQEGTRVILPWDIMNIYDARLQLIERDYDVLSSDGLRTTVNVAFRFRIDERTVGILHKLVGPKYLDSLLVSDVGSQARHMFAKYRPEEAFTERRTEIEVQIREGVEHNLSENFNPTNMQNVRFIFLEDVMIRGVQFPPSVAQAIERKTQEYNRAQQYEFAIAAERREAERKEIEARGIRAFQDTIKDGLTDNYLRWRGIEATLSLAQSHNAKVVIIGSGPGGLPIILGNMDDKGPAGSATGVTAPEALPLTPGASRSSLAPSTVTSGALTPESARTPTPPPPLQSPVGAVAPTQPMAP